MRNIRKLAVAGLFLVSAGAFAADTTQVQQCAPRSNDLGTAFPNAVNLSKDSRFNVYSWCSGNSRWFQINDANGQVLTAFIETAGKISRLNIGSFKGEVLASGRAAGELGAVSAAGTAGQCPCSSTVTYDDGYTKIVVTMDSQGNVINVAVINYRIQKY
jgi:hypothetical protein